MRLTGHLAAGASGVEHALGEHLLVRAEYLYEGYRHQSYVGDSGEWNDRRIGVSDTNLQMGLSYRF